jgi:hypothetical protein
MNRIEHEMNRIDEMNRPGETTSLNKNDISLSQFNEFLRKHYVDDIFYSHVSLDVPRGKFMFGRENLDKLYDVIPFGHHLAEKPGNYIPIYFDCDIKILKGDKTYFFDDGISHLYSKQQICDCITSIQSVFMNFGILPEKLICCLMEKQIYETEKHVKNGFHLFFPYLILHRETFVKSIFQPIFDLVKETTKLELDSLNEYTTPWLMYGGVKNSTSKPYLLTKIYNVDFNEMTIETFTNYEIFDSKENKIIINNDNVESLLPRIFSIMPSHREITEISKIKYVEPLIESKVEKVSDTDETEFSDTEIKENIRKINLLLPMINCDAGKRDITGNCFSKWSNVVKNCSYYTGMNDEIFELIDEWSQGYDSYGKNSKKENKKKFYEVGNNAYCNFGILVNYAKEDSPSEFEKAKNSIWKKNDSYPEDYDDELGLAEKIINDCTS